MANACGRWDSKGSSPRSWLASAKPRNPVSPAIAADNFPRAIASDIGMRLTSGDWHATHCSNTFRIRCSDTETGALRGLPPRRTFIRGQVTEGRPRRGRAISGKADGPDAFSASCRVLAAAGLLPQLGRRSRSISTTLLRSLAQNTRRLKLQAASLPQSEWLKRRRREPCATVLRSRMVSNSVLMKRYRLAPTANSTRPKKPSAVGKLLHQPPKRGLCGPLAPVLDDADEPQLELPIDGLPALLTSSLRSSIVSEAAAQRHLAERDSPCRAWLHGASRWMIEQLPQAIIDTTAAGRSGQMNDREAALRQRLKVASAEPRTCSTEHRSV